MLFFACLITISIFITLLDRTLHSCGSSCNFLTWIILWFTPFDGALLSIESAFPVDYIMVSTISLFMMGSCLIMFSYHGMGLFGTSKFKVGPQVTEPQPLLLCAFSIILGGLGWLVAFSTAAPQYMTYGSQMFCNYVLPNGQRSCETMPASLYICQYASPISICTPTVISSILGRFLYTFPVFGLAIQFLQFCFCFVFLVSLVYNWKKLKSHSGDSDDDEDDEESNNSDSDERRRLI